MKKFFLITGIIFLVVVIGFLYVQNANKKSKSEQTDVSSEETNEIISVRREQKEKFKELTDISGHINTSEGFQIADLIGKKVILVDFWTYSCINCQRTLPYLNAWYEKYKDQGIEIIGVHTPEFSFEKKLENVKNAVQRYNIQYPVVLDNDYGTWKAYENRFWPRKYIIDINGYIVYDHIGEGAYEETEQIIQELLLERKNVFNEDMNISSEVSRPADVEFVDPAMPRTPEIYFGASRNREYLGNGKSSAIGIQNFKKPEIFQDSVLYLSGQWNIQEEYAKNENQGSEIVLRYKAQKVFMVASAERPSKVRILFDGKDLSQDIAGSDVTYENGRAYVNINDERLYRIIEDIEWGTHVLEIIIEDSNIFAYTFTFG